MKNGIQFIIIVIAYIALIGCSGYTVGLYIFEKPVQTLFIICTTVLGFLGCATKDIAKHFGKYFGMLVMVALYGDLPGIQIK